MKKYILMAAAMLTAGLGFAQTIDEEPTDTLSQEERIARLEAQNEQYRLEREKAQKAAERKSIWGKGRYTRLGFAIAETAPENSLTYKGSFAFSLTKGVTYRILPSKPIANCLLFGIDVTWIDLQFSKYKDPYEDDDNKWTSDIVMDNQYDDDDNPSIPDLGYMSLSGGMGIGPSVTIAPFVFTNVKRLKPLKAQLYFHYNPTYVGYMETNDGDLEFSGAFVNMLTFGGNISYKSFGVGVEGRWGEADFKPINFDSESLGSEKYKRKFANTRFYLQFAF